MDADYIKGVISMKVTAKTDYSSLFSGLSTNVQNSSFSLSDYASIKNGSYFKVMKAYYGKDGNGNSVAGQNGLDASVKGASTDNAAVNSNISSKASELMKSTQALWTSGKDSIFEKKDIVTKDEQGNETKTYDYDREGIAKAVNSFAKDYNNMIDAAMKSRNTNVISKATDMVMQSLRTEKYLNKVGITIGEDNKLSVDETKLKSADIASLKSLFSGAGSYAYDVQSKASYMNTYAKEDAAKTSGLYSPAATYQANLNTGNLLNSFL